METGQEERNSDYEFVQNLIILVREARFLYEKRDPFYFNRQKKDKAWLEIAEKLNKTPEDCKAKWTAMRERFVREIRKEEKPSGSGATDEVQWPLFKELEFLRKCVQPKRTRCNELLFDSSSTLPSPASSSPISPATPTSPEGTPEIFDFGQSPPPRKKTFNSLVEKVDETIGILQKEILSRASGDLKDNVTGENEDELFMRTAVLMMRPLSMNVRDRLKADFFQKITEARLDSSCN